MASVSREADRLHKHLLTDLCDMMDPNNPTYKNFIRCLVSDILPLGRLSGVQQNPTDVFLLLEERGVLKVGEYQYLEEALEASRYINILDHLKNAEKHIARQMRKRCYNDGPVDGCSSNSEAATVSSIEPEGDQLCECKHVRCGTIEMKDLQDIQLLLIEAYERVQIISVSPVFETSVNLKDLKDFYTDVVIEEEREESAQMKKGKQQINKKVTSFRQIFYKDDKKVTRIILKGPAGQGKSTFCRKLVHTWCSAQKKKLNLINDAISDEFETNDLKDENEILRFDILLYICLRDISDEKTLMDVVYNQFPLHESQDLSHRSHIEALIGQTVENKVLLIMDGLDEMANSSPFITKIMQKSLYPYLTVFASTRPWKIDQLGLIRSADSHLLLDLQGFSYENSMLFAKRLLDKYYKDKSVIEQFKKDISKNSVITSLIHVPLLLLFIVHVWYEKKSFPQTLHELYFEILNIVVNRYKECKERKQKCEGRQDERKGPPESMTFILTSKLRNLSLVQHYGEEFLADLCEVANHFLITDAEECSLVSEEKTLLELLGNIGLHAALDLGIFTKLEAPGIFTKRICLTFLHKTVQEFLAAISICCREGKCDIFLDSLNTLDDVFKNEMIIMFVAGISTSHCEKISEKIYDLCDKDLDFDRALTMVKSDLCFVNYPRDLCRLYRDCIREACGEPISLKLKYLYAKNKKEWDVLQPALRSKSEFSLSCFGNFFSRLTHISLEGLMLNGLTLTHISLRCCNIDDAKLDLSQSTCLVYLSLKKVTMKGKLLLSKCTQLKCMTLISCRLPDATMDLSESNSLSEISLQNISMKCKLLLSKCTQLKCLKLVQCSLDDSTLDLSECVCLTEFSLQHVVMKGKLLLSKCTQLKCLKLVQCSLDDSTLDLSECVCLTEFSLQHVVMKGKLLLSRGTQLKCIQLDHCSLDGWTLDLSDCSSLTKHSFQNGTKKGKLLLSDCTHLKCLQLVKCRLDDVMVNLSESNCLAILSLDDVTMKGKLLLSKCTQLECLKLLKCSLDDATLDLLESTRLTSLSLEHVTVKGKLLLSKCTQLEFLKLVKCSLDDATLDLSESTRLTNLNLSDVTMKGKLLLSKYTQLECLKLVKYSLDNAILDLSMSTRVTNVNFENVTIKGKLLLSKCTQLEHLKFVKCSLDDSALDLLELTRLTNLSLEDMTVKSKLLLSKCTQLEFLKLVKCRLNVATLDLTESTRLTNLSLEDVTVKVILMLPKCTHLMHLTLYNSHIDEFTLDFSGSTHLTKLILHDVTVTGKSKLKISNCPHLEYVKLQVARQMIYATLDLSYSTCLKELEITNVILDDWSDSDDLIYSRLNVKLCDGNKMCNSLYKCEYLTKLSLKAVGLGDALLSLDGFRCLNELILDKVTMSKDSKKMLFKRPSKHQWLTTLSIMNMDLDDTLLGLDLMKNLHHLNINNVAMCKEGYVMLCNSISMCTKLTHLSLTDLDLGDALLNLKSIKQLDHLTINNVTMRKDGYVMLCNSISKCTKLTHLSLMNLDLGDAMPCLDNLKEFEMVNITISLQCVDRIESSVQHKHSHRYPSADTERLVIEKDADSCEKRIVNYTKKGVDKDDDEMMWPLILPFYPHCYHSDFDYYISS